jgi:hypothetical protein
MLRGTPATAKPTSMRSNSTVSVAARPDYRAFGLRNGSFPAEIGQVQADGQIAQPPHPDRAAIHTGQERRPVADPRATMAAPSGSECEGGERKFA